MATGSSAGFPMPAPDWNRASRAPLGFGGCNSVVRFKCIPAADIATGIEGFARALKSRFEESRITEQRQSFFIGYSNSEET
jgi:hypothetical protein